MLAVRTPLALLAELAAGWFPVELGAQEPDLDLLERREVRERPTLLPRAALAAAEAAADTARLVPTELVGQVAATAPQGCQPGTGLVGQLVRATLAETPSTSLSAWGLTKAAAEAEAEAGRSPRAADSRRAAAVTAVAPAVEEEAAAALLTTWPEVTAEAAETVS